MTKRCTPLAAEALECLGGNGYVEESGMPRLLRESPLNSIWEGSGNVQALDVLRALQREPQALDAFLHGGRAGRAAPTTGWTAAIKDLLTELADLEGIEARARRLVERMALVLQGSLLVRYAPAGGRRRVLRLAAGRRLGRGLRHAAAQPGPGLGGGAGPAGAH